MTHGHRESDRRIASGKFPKKGGLRSHSAEGTERRRLAKGNTAKQSKHWTQSQDSLIQALDRVRQAARRNKGEKLTVLWHHVYNVDRLRAAYLGLKWESAAGRPALQTSDAVAALPENHASSSLVPFGRQYPRQEPGAVIPHAGICAGVLSNEHSYRD